MFFLKRSDLKRKSEANKLFSWGSRGKTAPEKFWKLGPSHIMDIAYLVLKNDYLEGYDSES